MEVSIQAVSPELGEQFSSVLASQAGAGGAEAAAGAGAAAAGAAGAGAAVCASAETTGSRIKASTASAAAPRRHAEPNERTIIRTLPRAKLSGSRYVVPHSHLESDRLQPVINKNRAIATGRRRASPSVRNSAVKPMSCRKMQRIFAYCAG